MTLVLAAAGLSAARSGEVIVGPLDFRLGGGEALVVTGENGAGKSTLLRVVAGLLPASGGTVRIEGALAGDGAPAQTVAEVAHYLGHRNAMKPALSVGANLDFWQRFHRAGAAGMPVEAALAVVGLPGTRHLPFGDLSAGQQRRAAIARLLVARRPVWILDEPTAALDAGSQGVFAALVRAHLAAGGIAVAATHQPLGIEAAELRLEGRRLGAAVAGMAGAASGGLGAHAEGWL